RLRNGAACCFRHSEQWQLSGLESGPVISNFTPPQRQLPRTVLISIYLSAVFTIPRQANSVILPCLLSGQLWVKTGSALVEHKISASPPKPDISAFNEYTP